MTDTQLPSLVAAASELNVEDTLSKLVENMDTSAFVGIAPADPTVLALHDMKVGTTSVSNNPLSTVITHAGDGSSSIGPSPFFMEEKALKEKLKNYSALEMLEIINQAEKRKDYFLNRIVCAANYFPGAGIILGPRHWDETMHSAYEKMEREHELRRVMNPELEDFPPGHKFAEGFIDKRGKWLTREEAWVIAEAAGQIIRRVGGDTLNGGRLFSENLY